MNIINFIRSNKEYFEDFITRSTYHSNAIEGNTLSYAETYAILFNDNSFTIKAKPRELYEAINHKYALSYVMEHCKNGDLTQDLIKHIGIQINKNIDEIDGYRKTPVMINGAEHMPPLPNLLPTLMMQFVYNYNNTVYKNPYERVAATHIEFERIHPFSDGNGRTGRLLINYEMLKHDLAPIVISVEQRKDYFAMLSKQDIDKLTVFLHDLSNQELERINTCKSISVDRMADQLSGAKKKADEYNQGLSMGTNYNKDEPHK